MAGLRRLFAERRRAQRRRPLAHSGESAPRLISARVRAEGCSGLRHIQIRDFHLFTDLGPDCAGFDLGPTPFELQLGALGSCLTQTFLCHAAARGVVVERIEVEVTGRIDPLAGAPGQDQRPATPRDIRYTLHVTSPASADEVARLRDAVERSCPILNLLVQPQPIRGTIVHDLGPAPEVAASPN
ncbi:MAG TPA: OsmC family protein [Thermomicrobiales bacterium]|jgi:uncharacterized OsmC-like protein